MELARVSPHDSRQMRLNQTHHAFIATWREQTSLCTYSLFGNIEYLLGNFYFSSHSAFDHQSYLSLKAYDLNGLYNLFQSVRKNYWGRCKIANAKHLNFQTTDFFQYLNKNLNLTFLWIETFVDKTDSLSPVYTMEQPVKCSSYQCSKGPSSSTKFCSGCKQARYCSNDCQKKNWKTRKAFCKHVSSNGASSTSMSCSEYSIKIAPYDLKAQALASEIHLALPTTADMSWVVLK